MKIVKLKKTNLSPFLKIISKGADLWAPVKKGVDSHSFAVIEDFSTIDLDYTRTILPPKKIMLPPDFNMFQASPKEYKPDFSHVSKKIIFGIHPCDIHSILTMEKFYSHVIEDPYYLEARKNTLIIGHSCMPDEHCMCKSTHTHTVDEGYDLFFTDQSEYYIVWIGSSRGDDLIRMTPDIFDEEITDDDIQNYIKWRENRDESFTTHINFEAMSDLMELKYNDELWETLGNACLACGACSNVCPTCNCYNVADRPQLGKNYSNISRCWDACTLENYSAVAGGENFREKKSDRLKLYYTHKLQAYISKYGKPACIGCGRCVATCPVGINVKTVSKALDGENVDSFWARLSLEVAK